jgi:hypothetical protein
MILMKLMNKNKDATPIARQGGRGVSLFSIKGAR